MLFTSGAQQAFVAEACSKVHKALENNAQKIKTVHGSIPKGYILV